MEDLAFRYKNKSGEDTSDLLRGQISILADDIRFKDILQNYKEPVKGAN